MNKLKITNGTRGLYSTMPLAMPSENSEQYVPMPTQTTSEPENMQGSRQNIHSGGLGKIVAQKPKSLTLKQKQLAKAIEQ